MADTTLDGCYSIAPYLADGMRCDVEGGTTAARANIQLHNNNDTNAQKVYIQTVGGYRRIQTLTMNVEIGQGMVWDVAGGKEAGAIAGQNVQQYLRNGTTAQDWVFIDDGTKIINGVAMKVVQIAPRINTNLRLDHEKALTSSKTNIRIWNKNGTDAQRWVLHRDSRFMSVLSVPANVGLAYSIGDTVRNGNWINISGKRYPGWVGMGPHYQIRYRTIFRKALTDTWTSWSAWKSIDTNSQADDGWGNAWGWVWSSTNGYTTQYYEPGLTLSLNGTTYDKGTVQIEVRVVSDNSGLNLPPWHGASCTGQVSLLFKPTITISTISFAPDGIRIPVQSNWKRNGHTITVTMKQGNKVIFSNFMKDQFKWDDTVVVPFDKLKNLPDEGSVTLTYTYRTIDGSSFTETVTKQLSYSAGHNSTLSATFKAAPGYAETVTIAGTHTTEKAWLLIDNGDGSRFIECDRKSDGSLIIVPPFGKTYQVWLLSQDSSDVWATKMFTRTMKAAVRGLFVWNYGDADFTALALDANFKLSTERDHNSVLTSGRRSESTSFGHGSKRPISLSGHVVPGARIDHSGYEDFRRLSVCNYATFRTPLGDWWRVAIIDTSEQAERSAFKEISVSMKEQS